MVLPQYQFFGDEVLFWAMKLSKCGYGSVDLLLSYSSDIFLSIMDYEVFVWEYDAERRVLNANR